MLSSTGRSARAGRGRRPRNSATAKSVTMPMAVRSATDHTGGKDSSRTLWTGQVRPQQITVVISRRRPVR